MKIQFIIVFILLVNFSNVIADINSDISILTFEKLEPRLHLKNDTVYVINFWATWCVPCRKELPEFEKIQKEYHNRQIKILLVSLDFTNQTDALTSFIEKNHIASEVVLLNAPDANNWIDKVDTGWSGSLPATLFYRNNTRKFYEGELDYKSIETQINSLLNP